MAALLPMSVALSPPVDAERPRRKKKLLFRIRW